MSVKRRAAAFTIAQNEPVFLPIWSRYYRQHFAPEDLYVLDHDSGDLTTVATAGTCTRVPVHRSESFNHGWLRDTVQFFQHFLLQSYEYVLFTEVDEIVFPDPEFHPGGLRQFVDDTRQVLVRCEGHELVHIEARGEPPLDLSMGRKILAQRGWIQASTAYSKLLLSCVPLGWEVGFHDLARLPPAAINSLWALPPQLHLLHLHRMDYQLAWAKCRETARRNWSRADLENGAGYQNRIVDEGQFRDWFYTDFHDGRPFNPRPVPDSWREVV